MTVERIPNLTGCCRHLGASFFWVSNTSLWIEEFAVPDYGDQLNNLQMVKMWVSSLPWTGQPLTSDGVREEWGEVDWEAHRWTPARSHVQSNSDPQLLLQLAQRIKIWPTTTSFPNFCPNFQLGRNQGKLSNLYQTNYTGCPISS